MRFSDAFDPFRGIANSWKLLLRAPAVVLIGGIVLMLTTYGDRGTEYTTEGDVTAWEALGLAALTAGGCITAAILFVIASFVSLTFPRAVAGVVRTGESRVGALLEPGDQFLSMLLVRILTQLTLLAVWIPLFLAALTLVGAAAALGAPEIGAALAIPLVLLWVPIALWVYLGIRLSELAVALEGLGPVDAIGRSWELTNGNRLSLFLFLFVTWVFALLGVLAFCIGTFVTVPMRFTALYQAYLNLISERDEHASWWLTQAST